MVASGWLGYSGATEAPVAAAETHLGIVLPSSRRRAFLRLANGWRCTSPFVDRLWSTTKIGWLRVRKQHLIAIWTAVDCQIAES